MAILSRFKKYIFAILDAFLILVAYGSAVKFLGQNPAWVNVPMTLYVSVITYLLIFWGFGVYHNMVMYADLREYVLCFIASVVSSLMVCLEGYVLRLPLLYKQVILTGVLTGVLCVSLRLFAQMSLRLYRRDRNKKVKGKRLLIVGAGVAGHLVVKELIATSQERYDVVGLIDDDKSKAGCQVAGYKVLGSRYSIPRICKEKKVEVILFAIPSADGKTRKEILDIAAKTGCRIQVLPNVNEMISGKSMVTSMRNVDVSDLLNRDPVKLNNESIGGLIRNKTVLVTGGGGSIGSELCRQIARFSPAKLLILDIYENNAYDIQQELKHKYPELSQRVIIASVRDKKRLEDVFAEYRPALVFHAAAHKHVPLMEDDPKEAVKNNVFGTWNVARCAEKYDVQKMVLISTDKAVNPTNIMGATKRICEMIVQSQNGLSKTEFVAVRFGNVLGSNGSVIPLFQRQIAAGGPVTVTHKDITRFFMTIPEAAQLVLQAAANAAGGEIFVLDMGEPVKIYDLAVNLIKLSGYKLGVNMDIEVVGLRPGEKLYEELMMEEEGLQATENKKIFIGKPLDINNETVRSYLTQLQEALAEKGDLALVQAISHIVPTYTADSRWNLSECVDEFE
ncbi:MAG: polysaccharide biosynthesis protein [Ruminococcaceae bacterium]|nr:polysaccharide biosynthesis protein [Oscillospiraceae bacterium]